MRISTLITGLTLVFLLPVGLFSQTYTVTGIVLSSEDGEPVIGATIEVKDNPDNLGTVTDFDGSFSVGVPDGDAVLLFSYVGLKTLEVEVSGPGDLGTINMFPESSLLEEVVVVGYGTTERSKISGSVSVIKAEDISETPILRTEQAIQGRTSGVTVSQNSGSPGSELTVRIRGTGTINGGDPLYIVDGVPVSGLDFLSPNDIESINILKDAASAAIYGSRGANGVVLITTKKGKKNQGGIIAYEGYFGVQSPSKKMHLLNAREYAIIQNEAYLAAGETPPAEFMNPLAFGEGTDWQDAIFEDAPITSHNLSISGGSEKSTYAVSGNYFKQDGIVGGPKARFERYTARLNGANQVNDWLDIGTNIGFTHFTRNALAENSQYTSPLMRALNMDPITPVRKFDGTYAYSLYADTDVANPVHQIEQTNDEWTSNRVLANVFTNIKFMEGLSFRTSYSVDATFANQDLFFPIFNLSVDTSLNDAPSIEISDENTVVLNRYSWINWQLENVLTYEKTFKEKHKFEALAGNTILENRQHVSGGANTGLPSNNPEDAYISNATGTIDSQTASEWATESSLISFFTRANYEYDNKYLFSTTLRVDGSSRFGANNRFGVFPSFSAGWVISQEDFFDIAPISFLKLRASWGSNGNNNIGDYAFSTIVFQGQNYAFGPAEDITNGAVATTAANPDIKWETITQTDIGLDVELWDGKLNVTTDYYIKNTRDMLYAAPIPHTAGTAAPVQNIATIRNNGWEFSATYRERATALKYSVGGNFSVVKNEVTNLGLGGDPVLSGFIQSANAFASQTDVGQPVASFFGYVTDGIFQNQAEVEAHAFQNEGTAPGDIRFADLNNDGVIDELDRTYIGNPTPRFSYGATIDLEYKGFDLGIFLQGVSGNDVYNGIVRYDFNYVNRPVSVLDRWTGEGTSDIEPRVNIKDPNQNSRISDRFIEDGSYMRVKNVQLGYNVPKKILETVRIKKLRVYIASQNLFTFTKYSGLDPEIGTIVRDNSLELGIDRGFYPQARTFLGGIQVTF